MDGFGKQAAKVFFEGAVVNNKSGGGSNKQNNDEKPMQQWEEIYKQAEQAARLELENKVRTLLQPILEESGGIMDVALLLADTVHSTNNRFNHTQELQPYSHDEARAFLMERGLGG